MAIAWLAHAQESNRTVQAVGPAAAGNRTAVRAQAEVHSALALAAFNAGEQVKARNQWEQAAQIDVSFAEPHYYLGILAELQDKVADGIAKYEHFLTLDTTSKLSTEVRIRLNDLNQIAKATSTPQGKEDYTVARDLARIRELREKGELQAAMSSVEKLSAAYPTRFEPKVMASTLCLRQQQPDQAAALMHEALKLCPADRREKVKKLLLDVEKEQRFRRELEEARELESKQNYAGAATSLRSALSLRPDDAEAGFQLAGVLTRSSAFREAVEALQNLARSSKNVAVIAEAKERIQQLRPLADAPTLEGKPVAHLMGGVPYLQAAASLKKGDTNAALQQVNEAIRAMTLDPTYSAYYILRGNLLVNSGDWEGAALDFQRASEINPTSTEACLGLARVAIHRNDLVRAAGLLGLASSQTRSPTVRDQLKLQQAAALAACGALKDAVDLLDDSYISSLRTDPTSYAVAMSCRAEWKKQLGAADAMRDLAAAHDAWPSPWSAFDLAASKNSETLQTNPKTRPTVDMSIFDK